MEMTEEEKMWLQEKYYQQLTQLYRNLNQNPNTPSGNASKEQIDRVENRLKELGIKSYPSRNIPFFRM